MKIHDPVKLDISDLIEDESNPNVMTPDQEKALNESLKKFGMVEPLIVGPKKQGKHTVYNGNHRLAALKKTGTKQVYGYIINKPETDIKLLRQITNKLHGKHDPKLDKLELNIIKKDTGREKLVLHLGSDVKRLIDNKPFRSGTVNMEQEEARQALAKKYKITKGDRYQLGSHTILCGDCTMPQDIKETDLILTDPPYSSGGWQEAQKMGASSVGTATKQTTILNDGLSTRGYTRLIKECLYHVQAKYLLMFGDWRMWTYNADTAETSGYIVKNMIVWDKQYVGPGMGEFRGQHELILFAPSSLAGKSKGGSTSPNIFSFPRTGNKHHVSEKPVELLIKLIEALPVKTVYDPFLGSGSTLLACENLGLTCYGVELDPKYVAMTIHRWEQMTGKKAEKA